MPIQNAAARISRRDVADLDKASTTLAVAAAQIKRMNPAWADAVIQLMIEVNETIVRIQTKGANAFARYYERHGLTNAPDDGSEIPVGDSNSLPPVGENE